jgi:hypothetical protein
MTKWRDGRTMDGKMDCPSKDKPVITAEDVIHERGNLSFRVGHAFSVNGRGYIPILRSYADESIKTGDFFPGEECSSYQEALKAGRRAFWQDVDKQKV